MAITEVWQIKRVRRQLDLTQDEMADLLGTSSATVLRYERGTTHPDRHVTELLSILAEVAQDPDRAHRVHDLLRRDTKRSLVLWYILDSVYGGKPKSG